MSWSCCRDMTTQDATNPWEDVVVSILSVNQYSLEKTYQVVDRLREQGLSNPDNLGRWTKDEIVVRLKQSGCDRGEFMTSLFAARLSNLGAALTSYGVEECTSILLSNDTRLLNELLLPIKGIGPKVMENIFLLRGIPSSAGR